MIVVTICTVWSIFTLTIIKAIDQHSIVSHVKFLKSTLHLKCLQPDVFIHIKLCYNLQSNR